MNSKESRLKFVKLALRTIQETNYLSISNSVTTEYPLTSKTT